MLCRQVLGSGAWHGVAHEPRGTRHPSEGDENEEGRRVTPSASSVHRAYRRVVLTERA